MRMRIDDDLDAYSEPNENVGQVLMFDALEFRWLMADVYLQIKNCEARTARARIIEGLAGPTRSLYQDNKYQDDVLQTLICWWL